MLEYNNLNLSVDTRVNNHYIDTGYIIYVTSELQSWPKYLAQSKEIQLNWTRLQKFVI